MSGVVIKILCLANGSPHELSGRYVVNYDPSPNGLPLGECVLETTTDTHQAKVYPDVVAAGQEWKRIDRRQPFRADGRPNRPLSAFTIEIERAPHA